MNSCALAACAAATICSRLAPGAAYAMFSAMLAEKSTVS